MPPTIEIITRLLLGALLGGVIGWERHSHGRPAGLRTHILVSLASTLVMVVSEFNRDAAAIGAANVSLDPNRLAAGAITGVGFLGAGVIVKSGGSVQGLTTAASLWALSVIGLAVGAGMYVPALMSFAVAWFALWVLRKVEGGISRLTYRVITVVEKGSGSLPAIRAILARHQLSIEGLDVERDVARIESTVRLAVSHRGEAPPEGLLEDLSSLPSVSRVSITAAPDAFRPSAGG
jgi:putative Mg2+ transporter-C (MgtC) family protein